MQSPPGECVSSKPKRKSYRRPDAAGARRDVTSAPAQRYVPQPRRRGGAGAWWPLAAAAGLTFVLVLLVLLANLDSPSIPSAP